MHLMLDLETLGTSQNAVVTQLGFCLFELNDEKPIICAEELYLNPREQISMGRTVDWDTLCWWNKQEEAARKNMFNEERATMTIGSALNHMELTILARLNPEPPVRPTREAFKKLEGVWAHGPTFDISLVESLYASQFRNAPWQYNAARDTRTMMMLARDIPMDKADIKHSAMSDAIAQATTMQKIMRRISNAFEA